MSVTPLTTAQRAAATRGAELAQDLPRLMLKAYQDGPPAPRALEREIAFHAALERVRETEICCAIETQFGVCVFEAEAEAFLAGFTAGMKAGGAR